LESVIKELNKEANEIDLISIDKFATVEFSDTFIKYYKESPIYNYIQRYVDTLKPIYTHILANEVTIFNSEFYYKIENVPIHSKYIPDSQLEFVYLWDDTNGVSGTNGANSLLSDNTKKEIIKYMNFMFKKGVNIREAVTDIVDDIEFRGSEEILDVGIENLKESLNSILTDDNENNNLSYALDVISKKCKKTRMGPNKIVEKAMNGEIDSIGTIFGDVETQLNKKGIDLNSLAGSLNVLKDKYVSDMAVKLETIGEDKQSKMKKEELDSFNMMKNMLNLLKSGGDLTTLTQIQQLMKR
jgi:hypothetical protein